jgi:hypothetical protein
MTQLLIIIPAWLPDQVGDRGISTRSRAELSDNAIDDELVGRRLGGYLAGLLERYAVAIPFRVRFTSEPIHPASDLPENAFDLFDGPIGLRHASAVVIQVLGVGCNQIAAFRYRFSAWAASRSNRSAISPVTRPLAGFTKLHRINLRESLLSLSLPMSSRARTSPPAARRADRETKWQNLRLATRTSAI